MTTTYDDNGKVTTVPPPTDPERIANLQRAVADAEARAEQAEQRLEKFKERVVQVGNEYAETHDWCSTYDEIMRELGLPGRTRDWPVHLRVHATYRVIIQASSEEEAEQIAMQRAVVSNTWKRTHPFGDIVTGDAQSVEFDLAEELF